MASFADSGTRPKIHADLHPKIHADLRAVAVFFHQEYDDCLDPRAGPAEWRPGKWTQHHGTRPSQVRQGRDRTVR